MKKIFLFFILFFSLPLKGLPNLEDTIFFAIGTTFVLFPLYMLYSIDKENKIDHKEEKTKKQIRTLRSKIYDLETNNNIELYKISLNSEKKFSFPNFERIKIIFKENTITLEQEKEVYFDNYINTKVDITKDIEKIDPFKIIKYTYPVNILNFETITKNLIDLFNKKDKNEDLFFAKFKNTSHNSNDSDTIFFYIKDKNNTIKTLDINNCNFLYLSPLHLLYDHL